MQQACVGVRVLIGGTAREQPERVVLLTCQANVRGHRVDEAHHLLVLTMQVAEQQQVERRGERGRVKEREADVHRVHVVGVLER